MEKLLKREKEVSTLTCQVEALQSQLKGKCLPHMVVSSYLSICLSILKASSCFMNCFCFAPCFPGFQSFQKLSDQRVDKIDTGTFLFNDELYSWTFKSNLIDYSVFLLNFSNSEWHFTVQAPWRGFVIFTQDESGMWGSAERIRLSLQSIRRILLSSDKKFYFHKPATSTNLQLASAAKIAC